MRGRILITDDEANIRFSARIVLKRAGYQVEEAENGEEALSAIASGKPVDLLLLDLNMPRVSGQEVVKVLRAQGNGMPIVAISGLTDGGVAREIIRLGCNAFLEKPFTPEELLQTVETVLAQGREELEGSGRRAPVAAYAGALPSKGLVIGELPS